MADMADLRRAYGVPARRGMTVTVDGKPGRITSARGCQYIMVRFGSLYFSRPCHPTWRVVYFDDLGNVLKRTAEC